MARNDVYARAGKPKPKPKVLGGEQSESKAAGRARLIWNFPPLTDDDLHALCVAYTDLTGRRVWPKVVPLLIMTARTHGPNTLPLLAELHAAHGVTDLLARALAHPLGNGAAVRPPEAQPLAAMPTMAAPTGGTVENAKNTNEYDDLMPLFEPAPPRPPVHVEGCRDEIGHRSYHRRIGAVFRCSLCDGGAAPT